MAKKKKDTTESPKDNKYQGAIAGGVLGIVAAAILKKKLIYGAIIGVIAGGYILHIAKNEKIIDRTNDFKPIYK